MILSPEASDIGGDIRRRHLLVLATGSYLDSFAWPPLPVQDEVRVWTDWLTAAELAGRRFTQLAPQLADSPTLDRLQHFFMEEMEQIGPSDALVVVVTGHGIVTDRVHRIVLTNAGSPPREKETLRSEQFISFLRDTEVQNALIVMDTCHAGELTRQMLYDAPLPPGWIGIAAAAPTGQARAGALSEAVSDFLSRSRGDEKYGGPNQPYLLASELVQFVTDRLGDDQDIVTFPRQARSVPSPCLPNPAFIGTHEGQARIAPARQEMAFRNEDLVAHWGPRSRGVQREGEPGWFFTGRTKLMTDLIAAARGSSGAYLVTGAAGSGKSAALSRLVTLSDPSFRASHPDLVAALPKDACPRVGDVDIAIHAQGRTPSEVLDRLLSALHVTLYQAGTGLGFAEIQRLQLEALRTRLAAQTVTIVVDGLDEATDPQAVLKDVLALLSNDWQHPNLRLIVGLRSSAVAGETPSEQLAETLTGMCRTVLRATELRVDAGPYWSDLDLIEYVRAILLTAPSGRLSTPYSPNPELALAMARRIAELVGTSYVVAQVVARQLANGDKLQDPEDPSWQGMVKAGLAQVLASELAVAFPDQRDRERALTVLRAASLAFGPGIPWRRIWPTIATAIADDGLSYGDRDIAWLLGHRVGGYLIRDLDAGTTVYRPFHQALSDALAIMWMDTSVVVPLEGTDGTDESRGNADQMSSSSDERLAAQHGRIVGALLSLLPAQDSDLTVEPDRYLRRHLAEHAKASGLLDQLLGNADFVLSADPDALVPTLAQSRDPSALAYRQAAHQLHGLAMQDRISVLQLAAQWAEATDLAGNLSPYTMERPWRFQWTRRQAFSPHSIVGQLPAGVAGLALTQLNGRLVIVAGSWDGTVTVCDMASGAPIGAPPVIHPGGVTAVAVAQHDGRHVIVACGERVWVRDLASGAYVGTAPAAPPARMTAVAIAELDGRPVVVAGCEDGLVWKWDLASGGQVGEPLSVHEDAVDAVAVAQFQGRSVVVSIAGGTLRLWDLASGDSVPSPLTDHVVDAHGVVVSEVDGRSVVVCRGGHFWMKAWDLDAGAVVGQPFVGTGQLGAFDVAQRRGGGIVAVAADWARLWRVDLELGAAIGEPLLGHHDIVKSVALARLEGRMVAVSGGRDGTVRVWDLSDSEPLGDASDYDGHVQGVGIAEVDGRPMAISGGGAIVRLWDLASGAPAGTRVADDVLLSFTVGSLDGRPMVVAGSDESVFVWDLAPGAPAREPLSVHSGPVMGVAIARGSGGTVVAAGLPDGTIGTWDLATGAPIGESLKGHAGVISAVAVGKLEGRTVLITAGSDGCVRIWDSDLRRGRLKRWRPHAKPWRFRRELVVPSEWIGAVAAADVDGRPLVVAGDWDNMLHVWDMATGEGVWGPLTGHTNYVSAVAPIGDGLVASGSKDGTVRVWDLRQGRSVYSIGVGHPINGLFAQDPLLLVACDIGLMAIALQPLG